VTYDRLRESWKKLTGQSAMPENNEFREFTRVMLETPVLEGKCLSAYREALEIFAGVLAHGNLPGAAQRLQSLLTGVFSKHFSHSYFVDWALGLPTRQATPIWSKEVVEWSWVRKDIGLTRIPTTVIAAIPMNTYGKKRDPIEEMLRVYRFQRRSFRFAQTLPETLGSKLENYGALFITSPDPAKSRPQRRGQVLELARRIHAFAQDELGGPALVGIGETVTPGETLFKSYQQAVLALHLGRNSGQEVVFFKPAGVEPAQGILEITRMFRELQRQIETASLSGLEPALDQFLKQVLTLSLNDPEKIRLHLQYGLIRMGETVCARSTLSGQESAQLLEGMVHSMEKAGTTQEMVLAFKDTLEKLLRLTQGQGALQANFSMDKVKNYLDEHFDEPLRVAKLARLAGVSASTLSRWFKKATGLGLETYLQDLRLEKARRLLKTGSLPVEQIARACGFKPGSHFSRFFRRKTGQSPQQFREKSQRS
jgi:AraC-like DNA-binding protein